MAIRSEREKSKMQEKYQMILAQMLKEEDNKYCVDCDTKRKKVKQNGIEVMRFSLQVLDGLVGILVYLSAFVVRDSIEI